MRERGISPSLYAGERVRTYARAYIYARSFELYSSLRGREREKERERAEKVQGREVDGESTEEVEGRLASIRERDADRVGESWVRSHKEVDTRRHLNPPHPPSRAPSVLLGATPPCRLPIANLRSATSLTLFLSSIVPSLYISPTLAAPFALHSVYIASLSSFLPFSPALRHYSLSLHWRSLRASLPTLAKGNSPQKQKREAKAAREDRRGWLEDFFVTTGRCYAS